MKIIYLFLILISFWANSIFAQETRVYDVSSLVVPFDDRELFSEKIGFTTESSSIGTMTLITHTETSMDDLVQLIQKFVVPKTWEKENHKISYHHKTLYIIQDRKVHQRIDEFLKNLEKVLHRKILVKIKVYELSLPYERNSLTQGETLFEKSSTKLIQEFSVQGFSGVRMNIATTESHHYLRDHDVEIAEGASIVDPIMGVFTEGNAFSVKALLTPDEKSAYLQGSFSFADLEKYRDYAISQNLKSNFQLPVAALRGIEGTLLLPLEKERIFGLFPYGEKLQAITVEVDLVSKTLSPEKEILSQGLFSVQSLSYIPENYDVYQLMPVTDITLPSAIRLTPDNQSNLEPTLEEVPTPYLPDEFKERYLEEYPHQFFRDILLVDVYPNQEKQIKEQLTKFVQSKTKPISIKVSCYSLKKNSSSDIVLSSKQFLSKEDKKLLAKNAHRQEHLQTACVKEQQAIAYSLKSYNFIKDYDVEIAKGASVYDPFIGSVSAGIRAQLKSLAVDQKGTLVYIHVFQSKVRDEFTQIIFDEGKVLENPGLETGQCEGKFFLPFGQDYILSVSENRKEKFIFVARVEALEVNQE